MDEKHEEHAQRKEKDGGVASQPRLIGEVGPRDAHAVRQNLGGQLLHARHRDALAAARRGVAVDLGGREHVVAHDAVGSVAPLHVENRAERHHLAAQVAGLQTRHLFRLGAVFAFRLGAHLEDASEAVEVVGVRRTQVDLQGVEEILERHVQLLCLDAIDFGVEQRRGGAEGREDAGYVRVGARRLHVRVGRRLQRGRAARGAILHQQLETAGGAEPLHRRRRDDEDVGLGDDAEPLLQSGEQLRRGRAVQALFERLGADEDRAGVRAGGTRRAGEAGERHRVVHPRSLEDHLAGSPYDGVGALERSAVRELDGDDQVPLVLRGDEAGRNAHEAVRGERQQRDVDGDADQGAASEPADRRCVDGAHALEAAIEEPEEAAEEAIPDAREPVGLRFVRFEQQGAEGGAESERVEGREHRRDGDGERELSIELAGDAADEGGRDEHRRQAEGDGDDRARDLVHRLARRIAR